jgi:hypothetical protein
MGECQLEVHIVVEPAAAAVLAPLVFVQVRLHSGHVFLEFVGERGREIEARSAAVVRVRAGGELFGPQAVDRQRTRLPDGALGLVPVPIRAEGGVPGQRQQIEIEIGAAGIAVRPLHVFSIGGARLPGGCRPPQLDVLPELQ